MMLQLSHIFVEKVQGLLESTDKKKFGKIFLKIEKYSPFLLKKYAKECVRIFEAVLKISNYGVLRSSPHLDGVQFLFKVHVFGVRLWFISTA